MNFHSNLPYERGIYNLFTQKTNPVQLPKGDLICLTDVHLEQLEKLIIQNNSTTKGKTEEKAELDYGEQFDDREPKVEIQKDYENKASLNQDKLTGRMSNNSNIIIIDVPPSSRSGNTLKDPKHFYNVGGNKDSIINIENNSNKNENKSTYITESQAHQNTNQDQNLKQTQFVDENYLIVLPKNLFAGFNHQINKFYSSDEKYINENAQKPHLFSFLNGTNKGNFYKHRNNYPIPYFINTEELQQNPNLSKESVLFGLSISDKMGLVLLDPEIVKKFKGLVGEIIKQVLKAIFGTPISLPVRIFEPKSTLSRICDYWCFAPSFLSKAAETADPVARMKLVISFAISGLYVPTKQLKPFNPLLGETFQAEFDDGSKMYAEHICHHPTISTFYLKGKDDLYYLSAFFDFVTATESFGSVLKVYQKGPVTVNFNKLGNERIQYCMPTIKLLNSNSENNRASIWFEDMIFTDTRNNLKAVISFGKDSKYIHGFQGKIFKNVFAPNYKFNVETINSERTLVSKVAKLPAISTIKGSWLKNILFDKEELWNIDEYIPSFIKPDYFVLPSDGRFREDLIWLFRSWNSQDEDTRKTYEHYSQSWKLLIEIVQRSDREERKKKRLKK